MSQDPGIEELVLSGKFFSSSRSASPLRSLSRSRSPSPDPLWPSNGNATDSDLSTSPPERNFSLQNGAEWPGVSRLGRTGVKGVLQDRQEAMSLEKAKMDKDIRETNRRMEKMALSARTYTEDEEEREREKRQLEGANAQNQGGGRAKRLFQRSGNFGQLREIGLEGFESAVEDEMSETWVLIHIYDPSVSRCHDLDAILARLARKYPQTKFLRARAGAVGFFSSEYMSQGPAKPQPNLITISEKELYLEEDPCSYDDIEEETQDNTDATVLPTLLAYRSGDLRHAWVRVDMEVEALGGKGKNVGGEGGVEALLQSHNVIQPTGNGNCGFSSDDEDLDLLARDPGGEVDDEDLFDL